MTQRELAIELDISEGMVSRLKQKGMPTHSVGAAQAWRASNLDPALVKAIRRPYRAASPAGTAQVPFDPEVIAGLLEAAAEAIVCNLIVDCEITMDKASLAVSVVSCCVSDVLEARGFKDNDVWTVSGPLAGALDPDEVQTVRARIEALVVQIRAENAAADTTP